MYKVRFMFIGLPPAWDRRLFLALEPVVMMTSVNAKLVVN